MSKGKSESKPVKRGVVVNRRHNRTVPQNVQRSNPKWEDVGNGVLQLKGPGNCTAFIRHQGTKFASMTRKQVDVALAPKATDIIDEAPLSKAA